MSLTDIAAVLREHWADCYDLETGQRTCECGHPISSEVDQSEHVAERVMDALTEAGQVEWGVRIETRPGYIHTQTALSKELAEIKRPGWRGIVRRIVTSWEQA